MSDYMRQVLEQTDSTFVYFIQADRKGLIKIGKAKDINKRVKALQTGCPVELKLLSAIESDHKVNEDKIHKVFKDIRVRGEWFEPTAELLEFIFLTIGACRKGNRDPVIKFLEKKLETVCKSPKNLPA